MRQRTILLTLLGLCAATLAACGEEEGGCEFNSDCALEQQCVDSRCVALDEGEPDQGTPDEGTPDEGTPDEGTPDEGTPDEGLPDMDTPDEATPDMEPADIVEDSVDMGDPDEGEDVPPDMAACEPSPEICDGVDNNCDDVVDEGCDDDGDGFCDAAMVFAEGARCARGDGDCDDTVAAINPDAAELCDGLDNNCAEGADEGCDDDGDGFCDAALTVAEGALCANGAGDCDDTVAAINPAATEICDGINNDCIAGADEGCDDDGDGFCDAALVVAEGALCANGGGDCADDSPADNPDVAERCDGIDNNCDGTVDEGCDDDGDGYCDAALVVEGGALCANGGGDCDDTVAAINPAATESCDGADNNCAEGVDEGCDDDGDGYCDAALIFVEGALCANGAGDCDDMAAAINPAAAEICDGVDNNCVDAIDEGCDDDNDGYCDAALTVAEGALCANGGGDCDDMVAAINPAAAEICDGLDNNCAVGVDEGCDDDGDGYCDAALVFVEGALCANGAGDCDDEVADTNPGQIERCDGVDNNCVDSIDEGCDNDNDGYCDAALIFVEGALCANGPGDCDDLSAAINPAAIESCDGADNNCAAGVDEGCDDDGDGYCDRNLNYVNNQAVLATCPRGQGDCNDNLARTNPGATEACDFQDNDCDDRADEGCDDDGDRFCDVTLEFISPDGLRTCPLGAGDCNDGAATINPGEFEACDGIDNNCAEGVDEGCDDDGDGYCDRGRVFRPGGLVTCPNGDNDCNDNNDAIRPGATELCDGVDNDCDNFVDSADPGYNVLCPKNQGVCAGLVQRCFGGRPEPCDLRYASYASGRGDTYQEDVAFVGESLCDGDDNNCDGRVDESCDPAQCQHLAPSPLIQMPNHVSRAPAMAQSPAGLLGVVWFQAPTSGLQSSGLLHYAVIDPVDPVIDVRFQTAPLLSLYEHADITWDDSRGVFLVATATRQDPSNQLMANMTVGIQELTPAGQLGQRNVIVTMSRSQPAYRFGDLSVSVLAGRAAMAYTLRSETNTAPTICVGSSLTAMTCSPLNVQNTEYPQAFTDLNGEHQVGIQVHSSSSALLSYVVTGTSTLRLFRVTMTTGNVLTRASVDVVYPNTPVWQQLIPDPDQAGTWLVAHSEFSNNPARRWGALRRWNPAETTTTLISREQIISVFATEQRFSISSARDEALRLDLFNAAPYIDGVRYADHSVSRTPALAAPAAQGSPLTPIAFGSNTGAGLHLLFVDRDGQPLCLPRPQ